MKFFLKVGNNVYGWASKRAAEAWAKANGVPRNKITTTKPSGSNPKSAPKPVPTRNNKGNFTKPRPVTKPKTTTVGNKPQAPSVPARPKVDKAPANQPKTRAVATKNNPKTKNTMKDITPPTRAISGSSKPKPPKPVSKPNAKSAAAGALRLSTTVGSAPSIDTKAPTAKTKPNNKSGEMPKKKKKEDPKRKTSPKPKLRPAAGPTTNESFGKAFARNRKAGNATFTWKGKKYTTRHKEESIAQHKKKFGVEGKY